MATTFSQLGINNALLQGLNILNITRPTGIQLKIIPLALNQTEDLVGLAKTGSGKTAAFGLPLMQLVDPSKKELQAIILVPTRELAQQIHKQLSEIGREVNDLSIALVSGGSSVKAQKEQFKKPVHIIVATPGRLLDLVDQEVIKVADVDYLVLDEADEMISTFHEELGKIKALLTKKRRTFLFTATMSGAVKQMIQNYLSKNVIEVEVEMETVGHQAVDHQYVVVEPIEKLDVLMHFLNSRAGERGIIFCRTKAAVNKLGKNLAINKFSSGAMHGSLTQKIRDRIMEQFRNSHIDILIATDLVARGIDVKDLDFVVNYHLPDTFDAYVHRSGRTARAGKNGLALTVIQADEIKDIAEFELELGIEFKAMEKADAQSIAENNALLWAKKIFKTKPNHEVDDKLKSEIKTVFHHLTKEELIEKVLADYLKNNTKED
ncbi:ATP-dependent helicase [Putridiphycobacter roseus]|uniref:ATP-dependent helicase n=1 Tax=Putridiphycobacter roseus TaxID=2219161 RepID=A0A2W1NPF5_9FLAO|nr:DEAD/DEAH box helicase [Putridiphycobacter roseus]PZE17512.1 ATP-dependent helicase [Putridiphycobacter roseus]